MTAALEGVSGQQHAPAALYLPGKTQIPIVQDVGSPPGPVWTDGKYRPHRESIPDRPGRSQSLYWLSYPAHTKYYWSDKVKKKENSIMGEKERCIQGFGGGDRTEIHLTQA